MVAVVAVGCQGLVGLGGEEHRNAVSAFCSS